MSIQAQFDNVAINKLTKIKLIIASSDSFNANQIKNRTLRECMNTCKSIDGMSFQELNNFQDDLISIFKFNEWTK